VGDASEEVETAPFDPATQRGHPYSQSPHSLCTEMLLMRRLAAETTATGSSPSLSSLSSSSSVPVLLVSYDDVLQSPHATADRVLAFVGRGDAASKATVNAFITQCVVAV
jgi:hypothetical protein